jgi:hypothetical protein
MHSLRREPLTKRSDPLAERRNSASHEFRCNPSGTFKALTASVGIRRSVERGREVTYVSGKPPALTGNVVSGGYVLACIGTTVFYTCDAALGK